MVSGRDRTGLGEARARSTRRPKLVVPQQRGCPVGDAARRPGEIPPAALATVPVLGPIGASTGDAENVYRTEHDVTPRRFA